MAPASRSTAFHRGTTFSSRSSPCIGSSQNLQPLDSHIPPRVFCSSAAGSGQRIKCLTAGLISPLARFNNQVVERLLDLFVDRIRRRADFCRDLLLIEKEGLPHFRRILLQWEREAPVEGAVGGLVVVAARAGSAEAVAVDTAILMGHHLVDLFGDIAERCQR